MPGRALFPRIISTLQGFTESDNELLVSHLHMSYKPFISIFSESLTSFLARSRLAGLAETESLLSGPACADITNLVASTDPVLQYPDAMVDYASSLTFELRHGGSGSSGYDVRLGFRNGSSADGDLTYYPMFGTNDVDIDLGTFVSNLQVRVKSGKGFASILTLQRDLTSSFFLPRA